MVGVPRRKHFVVHHFGQTRVWRIESAPPVLVGDDGLFVLLGGLVELLRREPHAIAFQPKGQIERLGRDSLDVIRTVACGRPLDVPGPHLFEQAHVVARRDMGGALEAHVLDEVS